MDDRGDPFVRKDSIGTTFETTFLEYFILENEEQERVSSGEEDSEPLYATPFEQIDYFHRNTISYVRKLGELKVIPAFPRR